jgi:hypothetical protein
MYDRRSYGAEVLMDLLDPMDEDKRKESFVEIFQTFPEQVPYMLIDDYERYLEGKERDVTPPSARGFDHENDDYSDVFGLSEAETIIMNKNADKIADILKKYDFFDIRNETLKEELGKLWDNEFGGLSVRLAAISINAFVSGVTRNIIERDNGFFAKSMKVIRTHELEAMAK